MYIENMLKGTSTVQQRLRLTKYSYTWYSLYLFMILILGKIKHGIS